MDENKFIEDYLREQFTAPIADYSDCMERVAEARAEYRRQFSSL